MNVSEDFIHFAARNLGEPVINAREQGEDRSRRNNIMEMRDDIIGIMQMDIRRGLAPKGSPVSPPIPNIGKKTRRTASGTLKRIDPPQSERKRQVRIITEGIEMIIVVVWKNALMAVPMPVRYI